MDVGVAASINAYCVPRMHILHVIEMATKRFLSSSSKSKKQSGKYHLLRFVDGKQKRKRSIKHSWLRCDKTNESVELLWCASCRSEKLFSSVDFWFS